MVFSAFPAFAKGGGAHPLFSRPHLLPSPLTLPAGTLAYGTSLAYGVTDSLQVGTDLFRLFFRVWNADARASVLATEEFALGVGLGFERVNLRDIDDRNPDLALTSFRPGATFAFALSEYLAAFAGGHALLSTPPPRRDGIETSGYVRGSDVELDLAWVYEGASAGNSLALGVSYDVTYRLAGFGLSHHFPGFQVGLHWFPRADRNPLLPILAGGGAVQF